MLRSLSFKADPPLPFHTYNYHLKKAKKEGYIDNYLDHVVRLGIIQQVLDGLKEVFAIPEDYRIILLKENKFLINSLASLVQGGIIIAGSSAFSDSFIMQADEDFNPDLQSKDLSAKGIKIISRRDPKNEKFGKVSPEDLVSKNMDEMSLIIQDIDPMTGRKLRPDDLKESLDLKALDFIHLDISLSSPTDPLDYQNIQSFSFETKYGFGMDQDLVVWISRQDLLNVLLEKTSGTFM